MSDNYVDAVFTMFQGGLDLKKEETRVFLSYIVNQANNVDFQIRREIIFFLYT